MKIESLVGNPSELEKILAKLSPKAVPTTHHEPAGSSQITPAKASLPAASLTEAVDPYSQDDKTAELLQLKQELLAANSKIALQEQELAQTRVIKQTLDQALGPPSEADFGGREITEQTISHLQSAFNASNPAFGQIPDAWSAQEDSQSDISDALSAGAYNRARGLWNQQDQPSLGITTQDSPFDKSYGDPLQGSNSMNQDPSRFWGGSTAYPAFAGHGALQSHRVLSGPSASTYGFYSRSPSEQSRCFQAPNPSLRRSIAPGNRGGASYPAQNTSWGGFTSGPSSDPIPKSPGSPTNRSSSAFQQIGIYSMPPYHARPVATSLSPTATEFTTTTTSGTSWATSSVRNVITRLLDLH